LPVQGHEPAAPELGRHGPPGDRDQAQQHLTTAMAMYREMGMTYRLEQAAVETQQPE